MIIHSMQNGLEGQYNVIAPTPVTNKDMIKAIAYKLNRPFIPFSTSAIVRLVLRELSAILSDSQRAVSEKIELAGFEFGFPKLEANPKDIFYRKI